MTTASQATILLVDDDDEIRATAPLILTLEGYRVVTACDGQEALQLITEGKCLPQLIISDIAMPHMDGYAFFEAVRQLPHLRTMPFIFLTAFGSRQHIHLGRELGADDYLVKPFEPSELLASVRSRLGRTQEIRQQVERELSDVRRMLVQLLSHELRTPLTYITGGFELLAELLAQQSNQEDISTSIDLIRSGAQRLLRLAEQVVTYTELVSGFTKKQLDEFGEAIALSELVESAIGMAYPELRARNIALELRRAIDMTAEVRGLPKLLTNAIYEVIRNAITFSPEGSTISVHLSHEGPFASIRVVDQGSGILESDLAYVWEVMAQSDRQRREQQGAGMGLPIVRQTMRVHGGDAELESSPGRGTTVTLRLPLISS
ncbi:MAG: hybrid sensor histidine kinase/response regulator [Chloroflexota bacterium]|jgi:signal transduction histidine kinase|nr:MAG: hybrid sensor histidine kinase/response regulator [Chloroflexota bacterium]